jgi:hypothetical protein
MTVAVIHGTLFFVGQHGVGLAAFLEHLFRTVLGIAIRVVLHRQLAIGALDLLIGSSAFDTKNFVVIAFCICGQKNISRSPFPVGSEAGFPSCNESASLCRPSGARIVL